MAEQIRYKPGSTLIEIAEAEARRDSKYFGEYFGRLIQVSGKMQKEIAKDMGYDSHNTVTLIKKDKRNSGISMPMDKIGAFASSIGVDPFRVLEMHLKHQRSELYKHLAPMLNEFFETRETMKTINNKYGIKNNQQLLDVLDKTLGEGKNKEVVDILATESQ